MIRGLLSQSTVTDLDRAEEWYARLFGRAPDRRPMDGLIEWQLAESFGVQVWRDPARAGGCTTVIFEDDLDGAVDRLAEAGVDHDGPQPGGGGRVVQLADPDGNRVVLVG